MVGDLNVRFESLYGEEAVRWALVWILLALVVCAATTVLAARTLPADLERARADLPRDDSDPA